MQRVARYGIAYRINAEVIAILAIGRDWFVVWDCAIIVLSHCHFETVCMRNSARWANFSALASYARTRGRFCEKPCEVMERCRFFLSA